MIQKAWLLESIGNCGCTLRTKLKLNARQVVYVSTLENEENFFEKIWEKGSFNAPEKPWEKVLQNMVDKKC